MKIKPWLTAFRLRTLPLAFAGWLVGTSIAWAQGSFRGGVAALTLLTAWLLQILSNVANDFGDAASGVDATGRAGPKRMVSAGEISARQMKKAIVLFVVLSLLSGISLLLLAFPEDVVSLLLFLAIGIGGIVAAIKYTVGKNPYGYVGFGDVFVFLFFGGVLVFGTYFLQTKGIDWQVLLPAASMGFLSVAVLNVNNIRDIASDLVAGKQSIPARLGRAGGVVYHAVLLLGAVVAASAFVLLRGGSWQWLFLPSLVVFAVHLKAVATQAPEHLDPQLKQMALSTLLFAVLFALGQLLS